MKTAAPAIPAPVTPRTREDRAQWKPVLRAPEYGSNLWLLRAQLLGLIGAVLVGLLIPRVCQRVLKGANDSWPATSQGWEKICGGASLGILAGIAFWIYLCVIARRPHWLLYFILTLWPVVEWGNLYLLGERGINLHLRPLLLLFLGVPACWLACCHRRRLLPRIHFLKYYGLFVGWAVLYFVARNAESVSPGLAHHAMYVEGSQQLATYFHCLFGSIIAGATVFAARSSADLFDRFNRVLLGFSSLLAIGTLAGAAAGLFTAQVDGIERLCGIFTHPNPFAHHQGVLLVYFLGLHWYYTAKGRSRIPGWLVGGAIAVHLAVFVLSLSKSAIIAFALAGVFIVLAYLLFTPGWAWGLKMVGAASLLSLAGVAVLQTHEGTSPALVIRTRIEEHGTFAWRVAAWDYVKRNIDADHLLLGHGLAASSYRMYDFADRPNATPLAMVHNHASIFAARIPIEEHRTLEWRLAASDYVKRNIDANHLLPGHGLSAGGTRMSGSAGNWDFKPLAMVHNGYLAILYDFGLPGWLMFAAAAAIMWQAYRLLSWPAGNSNAAMPVTVIALMIYFLVVCGVDEIVCMFDATILVWTLASLLIAMATEEEAEA